MNERPLVSAPITSVQQMYKEVAINVEKYTPHVPSHEIIYRLGRKTKEDLIQDIVLTLVDKHNNKSIPFSFETLTAAYVRSRTRYYLIDAYRRGANRVKNVSFEEYDWDEVSSPEDSSDVVFVQELMASLPERSQLLLSYNMLGYTHKEVSQLVTEAGWKLAPDTVKVKLSKIKKYLRDNFSVDASL
jgi:DNA-directed RNA polymerase specialized sigma24 family protein